ncbi:UbiD family decarboxylase [Roseibium marinum]|uniref:4-hydroxy-3-polyprenylbenzoate decarboxylase n=1 Tax=Roseibium marinum TaxID=281252 RepID=A0A2S3UJ67_9HYPH|nr:UbiD family decarboxylase [Roseibium marinum]POF27736.1 4-hydroxy-3-polyprenylbenzoate decarboxylase [Roseibium marinum]
MSSRDLQPFRNLKEFLAFLSENRDLLHVRDRVDVELEATALHRKAIESGGPALLLETPAKADVKQFVAPLLVNLFGTRKRVANGLGLTPDHLPELGEFLASLRAPSPPATLRETFKLFPVARAGLNTRPKRVSFDKQLKAAAPDLTQLPVQTCWPDDAGPLITWGVVVTRPPGPDDPRSYNLGIYRMQVLGKDTAIIRWLPFRGGARHYRQWRDEGKVMPVAVMIGCDPATLLAAVMPAPGNISELALAGIFNNSSARLSPCSMIDMHVPESAEIVLEGEVQPEETALEGPFGDHTGYYNDPAPYPLFRLRTLRMRDNAVYLSTFTGRAPDEPSVIGEAMTDLFGPILRQALPEILDVFLPPATCSYRVAILAIDKLYPGQAKRAMLGFWSLLPQFSMTKYVIAVDPDINLRDWDEVMWAVATRSDPERDMIVLEGTPIDQLDFASPRVGLGGKLGIDATVKFGSETSRPFAARLVMPDDVDARAEELFAALTRKTNTEGSAR